MASTYATAAAFHWAAIHVSLLSPTAANDKQLAGFLCRPTLSSSRLRRLALLSQFLRGALVSDFSPLLRQTALLGLRTNSAERTIP